MNIRTVLGLLSLTSFTSGEIQWRDYNVAKHVPSSHHKTLRPALHWDHDRSDLSNLVPNKTIGLYYTENGRARPNMAHQFTHVDHELEYPGVVLEHSEYIDKVVCHPGAMRVHVNAKPAWNIIKQTWNSTGGFILSEHTGGCGTDQKGQKVYWLAKSVVFDNEAMAAHVYAEEMELRDALANVKLMFGMWQPHGRPDLLKNKKYDWAKRSFAKSSDQWKPKLGKLKRAFQFRGNFQQAKAQVSPADSCGDPIVMGPGGLPSASCGTQFDQQLDDKIGYLNFSSASQFAASLKDVAPNLNDYKVADYETPKEVGKPPSRYRRQLTSYELVELADRGFFESIGAWFAAAAQAVANFVKAAAAVVLEVVTEIANLIGEAVTALVEEIGRFIIKGLVSLFGPELSVNIPLNAQAPLNSKSGPFGPSTKLYSVSETKGNNTQSITFYCVKCGVTGKVLLFGRFEFAPKGSSLTTGQLGVMGNLDGRVVLGIEAEYRKHLRKLEKSLVDVGLPGFSIPKLITVGPVAQLKSSASAYVRVQGLVQMGTEVSIGPFEAVLDLINKADSKAQGLTIKTKPIFSATGHLGGGITLGLPLSIGFGIVIPLINFEKTAAIINEPFISAELDYEVGDSYVAFIIKLYNDITADVFGLFNYELISIISKTISKGKIPVPSVNKRSELPVLEPGFETDFVEFRAENDEESHLDKYSTIEERANPDFGDPPITPPLTENTENFPSLSESALAEARMYESKPNGADVEKFGFSFTQIFDSTGNYHLLNEDNGNFGLAPATDSNTTNGGLEFETYQGMVVSDYGLRMLHFYSGEMNQYQVSRFRLADPGKVPADSKMVVLQAFDINQLQGLPASNTSDPLVYLAVDTERNVYFPITCSYSDDQPSKIFLVKNSETGPTTLMDPDLQHTVTGGVVQECLFMPFVQNGGPGDEFGLGDGITGPGGVNVSQPVSLSIADLVPTAVGGILDGGNIPP